MFITGAGYLEAKKEDINNLNVFPVPDGDTGTNMLLTLSQAVKDISSLPEDAGLDEMGNRISSGTLRGARGNSGVILSQLCRGFCKGIEGLQTIDKYNAAVAMSKSVQAAYKAVMQPQEGTILTVAREASEKAADICRTDISMEEFLLEILKEAEASLARTPELLPVLKEAGVIDSGGQGLIVFLKGAIDAFRGREIHHSTVEVSDFTHVNKEPAAYELCNEEIKFGYCTEFIIELDHHFSPEDEQDLKEFLASIGDSIVCVSMDDVVKVHVHTNHPGQAIEKALSYGPLSNMKIDNMRKEHHQKVIREQPDETSPAIPAARRENAFIAVCSGEGIAEIFRSMSVDIIIEGGQTMNPSTQDFLRAVEEADAVNTFILPNNGNVLLAAQQAKRLCEGKNVCVIPTKTICQGINAMIGYVPSLDAEGNAESMTAYAEDIKTGEVTYAVRDSHMNNLDIKEGEFMGIADGTLMAVGPDRVETAVNLVERMSDDETEVITLYYGSDSDEEEANKVAGRISELLPDAEVETVYG
ncbi:MAG: DAK2 domain-containing protein, partial [Parasporobacterium sp.]|nr:DAK2 domain-containing protein [Parasporobacterium sp.]